MENQHNDGRIVVPYKNDKKAVTFYDTFFDIDGDAIKYDDIAVVQSDAMDHSFMYYIVFGKDFTYNFKFTTYDGAKHKLHRYGLSLYGIGLYKRIKSEFDGMADRMYNIVFRKVADRLVNRIENGAKVNICGLEISRDQIVYEKRKKTIVIDRNNFGRCYTNSGAYTNSVYLHVRDEKKPVFHCSLNDDNARLIVPIVNYFFEYKPSQQTAAPQQAMPSATL